MGPRQFHALARWVLDSWGNTSANQPKHRVGAGLDCVGEILRARVSRGCQGGIFGTQFSTPARLCPKERQHEFACRAESMDLLSVLSAPLGSSSSTGEEVFATSSDPVFFCLPKTYPCNQPQLSATASGDWLGNARGNCHPKKKAQRSLTSSGLMFVYRFNVAQLRCSENAGTSCTWYPSLKSRVTAVWRRS